MFPRNKHIVVEVVYRVEIQELKEDNGRYLGIDIGLDNLASIANNVGATPIIINGKGLKSVNKFYNKEISHYREVAQRMNNLDYTDQMNNLTDALSMMATGAVKAVGYIENISVVAEQAAASTQEASAASEEQAATMVSVSQAAESLAKLGESLTDLVAKFRV